MRRVTGIGGIFFKTADAPALQAWYRRHLGIDLDPTYGHAAFTWTDADGTPTGGTTIFSIGPDDGKGFGPGGAPFMINFRVDDVRALHAALAAEGCQVLEKIADSEYGVFACVIDPAGNKVELWQPPAGQ